jgi:hypothetical protein
MVGHRAWEGRPADRPRSGDAGVAVMEPANLGDRHYAPEGWGLHRAGSGSILLERLMRARAVVVGHVGAQEPAQMSGIENDDLIQALA